MHPEDDSNPETIAYEKGEASVDPSVDPFGERAGPRYEVHDLHAAGGIGEIWRARDRNVDRVVAMKKLQTRRATSDAVKSRFLREARITGRLEHPGVVPVYEIRRDEATGLPYYTMRFLHGRTLSAAVKALHAERDGGGPPLKSLLGLLGAFDVVCNTVAFAHSKGVVHRDLKCENVILGDFGEVVVVDWGLAKQLGRDDAEGEAVDLSEVSPDETVAGSILGTPAYMAPEQASGDTAEIGPAADVYGLCAILYEILCGRPPFVGANTIDVLEQVKRAPPDRPSEVVPGVPPALERICLTGLAKAPSERHASAERLSQAVRAWVSELAERRQAEEERERFFALSQDLLAIVDAEGNLRQVGPAWTTLLGRDRESLLGRPLLDHLHPADRGAAAETLEAAHSQRKPAKFEARALQADGASRWASWNVTPIARERSLYLVGRDVSELKRSQQLFEGVLQSAPDALVLIDASGRIVLANRQAENIFGYPQAELLGQPIEILVPHRFREKHPAYVAGFFQSSSFRPMGEGLPLRGLRKDGVEFPAEISLSAIALESSKLVAASIRDLTGR